MGQPEHGTAASDGGESARRGQPALDMVLEDDDQVRQTRRARHGALARARPLARVLRPPPGGAVLPKRDESTVFQNLCERFPDSTPAEVEAALAKAGGHAGPITVSM